MALDTDVIIVRVFKILENKRESLLNHCTTHGCPLFEIFGYYVPPISGPSPVRSLHISAGREMHLKALSNFQLRFNCNLSEVC